VSALIYLDYNATTPVAPEVLEAMMPWFSENFWNAASAHGPGMTAAAAVDRARQQVAAAIGARSSEIVFTSGASEANNLALKGVMRMASPSRTRVLVGATEHKAVLDTADWLATQGFTVETIPAGESGAVEVGTLLPMLDDSVAIVSVMLANNETGVIAPIADLAAAAHNVGAVFHTDATQALGRIPVDVRVLGVDLASFSAHKLYGPKGVGALFVGRRHSLETQVHGGGHERGFRSGTLNVPGIVGFGAAAERSTSNASAEALRQSELVERLLARLAEQVADFEVVASRSDRLPNTANVHFKGADAEAVMANTPQLAVSSGSACTSSIPTPSHVLRAMGMSDEVAYECVRISVGAPTTVEDVDQAAAALAAAVNRVRSMTSAVPA
jgi:cysteine desulfurase